MTLLHSVYTYFSSIDHHPHLYAVFDAISSTIDNVLTIKPSANVFVFGEFLVYHKDWLSNSGRTDRPGKLCYNFFILNNFPQVVNLPPQICECDTLSPALLVLFFLLNLVSVIQWCSPHWGILMLLSQFPLTFLQTQMGMALFIVQLMTIFNVTEAVSVIIWDVQCFCSHCWILWVGPVWIDEYIPRHKYQVQSYSPVQVSAVVLLP